MNPLTRRSVLRLTAGYPLAGAFHILRAAKPTDIRIEEIRFSFEDLPFRTPLKFGGVVVDRMTLLNVDCAVRTSGGRVGQGFGSMPLGNAWSFPSPTMSYDSTLNAMKALAERISTITSAWP